MVILQILYFSNAVDLLASVGLRDSSSAELTNGPTDEFDAFQLQRQFTTNIAGLELELIGTQISSQFGIYILFNALQYNGSLISITTANRETVLEVTLQESNSSTDLNTLVVSLNGMDFPFDLPIATTESPFQDIGIRLEDSLLVVTLNCTTVDFVVLQSEITPISVTGGTVNILGENAIVRLNLIRIHVCAQLYPPNSFIRKLSQGGVVR